MEADDQRNVSSSLHSFRSLQGSLTEKRASHERAFNNSCLETDEQDASEYQSQLSQRSSQRPSFRAPQEPFTAKDFVYGKLLGLGSYSKVVKATKKDTGVTYALKIMDKLHIVKENKTAYVKLERIILDQLDHPGIIRLFFTFQDAHYLYMGLECCEGGELFDQIQRKKRLSLDEARFYASELIEVMEYLHGQGLIHRDLKPENLLLTKDGHLKVADFGSAKTLKPFSNGLIQNLPDDKSCTFVGTAEYVSPEVLNSYPISTGVDLWALGCILYQMLVGRPPFKCATEYLTFQKVMARDFKLPDYLSPEAKDLIDRLLDLDPNKRPGAGPDGYVALKAHPFFQGIEWSQLWKLPAPPVVPPPASESLEDRSTVDDDDDDDDDALDPDWAFAHLGGTRIDDVATNQLGKVVQKLSSLDVNEPQLPPSQAAYETRKGLRNSADLSQGARIPANSPSRESMVTLGKDTIPSDDSPKCQNGPMHLKMKGALHGSGKIPSK